MKRHANLAVFIPHLGCPNDCLFCDQHLISGAAAAPEPGEVYQQIAAALAKLRLPEEKVQIAFFGGSFTCIGKEEMRAYLSCVAPFVQSGQVSGIRVSTRPDGINPEILDLLCAYSVTAVELGAQSMHDTTLSRIKRGHTAADVVKAAQLIRAYGLELGLQMMIGLPGETKPELLLESARAMAALRPHTIRLYPTLVLAGTGLYQLYSHGEYEPLTLEQGVDICYTLYRYFQDREVTVLRIGLHADESLRQSGIVAGPFHPAFGEMVYSRAYLARMSALLDDAVKRGVPLSGLDAHFAVARGCRSQAVGVRKENVRRLGAAFALRRILFTEQDGLPSGQAILLGVC